jgi:CheY-like chemotaxis protein
MRVDHTAPVLVVDDQTIMVDLTRRVLSRLGFEQIDREPNGERALVRLRSREYPSSSVTCTCSKSMDSSSCARCAGTSHLIELVSFS